MTREVILKELNRMTQKYNLVWDDIKTDADKAIHQINTLLSCDFPDVSIKLINNTATYTYRDDYGKDVPILEDIYFYTVVFPFMAMEILARDEEFTVVYQKYQQDFIKGKIELFSNKFNYIADRFRRPRVEGVFFPSNNQAANARLSVNLGSGGVPPNDGVTRAVMLKELNRLTLRYNLVWEDISTAADKAIYQINTLLGANFPSMTSILINDTATYSYINDRGTRFPIIKETYFHSVIFPFIAMEILAQDEEFTTIYQKYEQEFTKGKFEMFANEFNYVPSIFKRAQPQGLFFPANTPVEVTTVMNTSIPHTSNSTSVVGASSVSTSVDSSLYRDTLYALLEEYRQALTGRIIALEDAVATMDQIVVTEGEEPENPTENLIWLNVSLRR